MENSINILRSLKKERKILSNKFVDAMQQKYIKSLRNQSQARQYL